MAELSESAFEAIWAQAEKLLSVDALTIALCGPEPNRLVYEVVLRHGSKERHEGREVGEGLGTLVVRSGKPLLIRNFELEKGSLAYSWMGAPMVHEGRVIGYLGAEAPGQGAFEQKDLSILGLLAGWGATAIATEEWAGQHSLEEAASAAMLQAARVLGRDTEQDGLFRSIVEFLPTVISCNRCSIWSWMAEGDCFVPHFTSTGASREAQPLEAPTLSPSDAPALVSMLETTDPVLLSSEEIHGGSLGVFGAQNLSDAQSVAMLPLSSAGENVGMLFVVRCRSGEGFSAKEIGLLRGLSDVAALAIVNQRHHRQASEAAALRELNEMKSRLISTISHELRTPLSFIQAGSELLMQRLLDPEKFRQVADLVNQGASRLAEVVDDIIEFADLQSGTTQLFETSTNLAALAREAVEQAAAPAQRHRVVLADAEALPSVKVDSAKLKSVLVRSVRNAVNFSQDPSVVLVKLALADGRLRVEISDNGYGIPAEELDRVFEPFFRGEVSQARCIPGTGLGLSIVHQLVQLLGGEVEIHSQVDRGTTLSISVPVEIVAAESGESRTSTALPPSVSSPN